MRRRNRVVNYNEDELFEANKNRDKNTRTRSSKRYNDDDDDEDEDDNDSDVFYKERNEANTRPVRSSRLRVKVDNKENNSQENSSTRASRSFNSNNNSSNKAKSGSQSSTNPYDSVISQAFSAKRIDPDLKKKLLKLIRKIEEEDEGFLFAEPVSDDIAPGYSKIIREPMDLQKINAKFHGKQYESIEQLRDDMYKMFDNCEQYNEPDSCFVVEANRLRDIVDDVIAELEA